MRLDVALVDLGLARSRTQAAELIRSGRVRVGDIVARRPATPIPAGVVPVVDAEPWVSRAAYKLLGALNETGLEVPARVLDAGASTGGFTQVVLSRGAEAVYAVDVGTGQLAPELVVDPRVHRREQLNLRDLTLDHLESTPVQLIVADVSFISLTLLLEPLRAVLAEDGQALLMVKPQFEVGREKLGKGGVVRDPADRAEAVAGVVRAARDSGWHHRGTQESQLPGATGNREFFLWLAAQPLC